MKTDKLTEGELFLRQGGKKYYMTALYSKLKPLTICISYVSYAKKFYCHFGSEGLFTCRSFSYFKKRVAKMIVDHQLVILPEYTVYPDK